MQSPEFVFLIHYMHTVFLFLYELHLYSVYTRYNFRHVKQLMKQRSKYKTDVSAAFASD